MEEYRIANEDNRIYSMGLTRVDGGVHVCVVAEAKECGLLLFQSGGSTDFCKVDFPEAQRQGDVWSMTVLGDFTGVKYCFEKDGEMFADPYGRAFTGRDTWGETESVKRPMLSPVECTIFDWEGDEPLRRPYEESILYRIHVRGFTKHVSSKCRNKGTFAGVVEKISYLKELGITALELMPVNEFQEIILPKKAEGSPYPVEEPDGKVNYWGYTPGFYFAPKASYCSGRRKDPPGEFKRMVKALHRAGIEVIIELYFTGQENPALVLDAVRFWVREYHVDGVHLVGFAPQELLSRDPYLSATKLFATTWDQAPRGRIRHLAEYHDGFMVDMRRVLKGDENQMSQLIFRSRQNPDAHAVINYMANTNGFTMMDMVSYDTKHNEQNGENNQDGTAYNYSWNCGVEGPTRKKKIMALRKKQIRNSMLLLFLSQGTPLLLAGDEFGNSQNGNNNPYCQDNEVSWLNWNLLRTNRDLFDFTKRVIAFRKAHPVFHGKEEPKLMDYLACGRPDVSYHGVSAWYPQFENFRRQIGILYCGEYGRKAEGGRDDDFFVLYNMHWEPHEFDIPNLLKNQRWYVVFDTDDEAAGGVYEEGDEPEAGEKQFLAPARAIVVLKGKTIPGKEKAGKEDSKKQSEHNRDAGAEQ